MGLDVGAIVLSLGLLMMIAYRGLPVILFAPACALLAVALSGGPLLPTYTESFMTGAAEYVRAFFPIFLLGAVFGKLIETSGAAATIAGAIVRALGPGRAIPAVVLACGVLTYGGVSLFVVAFAVYPLGAVLFREAGIPKRLLPGAIALGAFTFTMDALPGSPQLQNLIPTRYFGTDAYAAPVVGCIGGAMVLAGGLAWLGYRRGRAVATGEGYGVGHLNEPETRAEGDGPGLVWALLAIFNTASEVGFGTVIKTLPGFQTIRGWVLGASQHVLLSEAVAVNVLAGITGSASGGLSIALEVMAGHYQEAARVQGVSAELLHRIAAMASGGMDTLPHNGAVITLLAITGLTHRQSYVDILAITLLKTATVFTLAAALSWS
jgi:H+/gluconate symporter-like permease